MNLHDPVQLDIAQDDDWTRLRDTFIPYRSERGTGFDGVVMRALLSLIFGQARAWTDQ